MIGFILLVIILWILLSAVSGEINLVDLAIAVVVTICLLGIN